MNIVIEKASPTDAELILEFLKLVGSETDNLTFGSEGMPFSIEAEISYISQIENSKDDIMLIAKKDKKIVGIASLNRLPRRMKHRGEFSVSVAKEYWNHGIASKLLFEIIKYAKTNSFDIIDLQVRSNNKRAIHIYEKFGFKQIGIHPSFFKINNENISFIYMYLNLQ